MAETADYNLLEIRKGKKKWLVLLNVTEHSQKKTITEIIIKKEQDWGFSHDVMSSKNFFERKCP